MSHKSRQLKDVLDEVQHHGYSIPEEVSERIAGLVRQRELLLEEYRAIVQRVKR